MTVLLPTLQVCDGPRQRAARPLGQRNLWREHRELGDAGYACGRRDRPVLPLGTGQRTDWSPSMSSKVEPAAHAALHVHH